ncbi:hypothetical protein GCM10027277_20470 [Pseudoduganella ginsengisoli]|uniref:Uncharacterized protein n=1 Tax=Pseudoduganella ginsengisoli TaxID=1462440 RepID=A0A6L6PTD7_9BURK|nr:DUF6404 family protein [Pseudoduganella ginsengisoli]MTW00697.1 hypothetical protein [Pseudoduganella ginsengisoli]
MTITKRDAALAIMAKTGIMKSNYYPPILRLLWGMGVHLPLPHFASFGRVALVSGGFFGPAWGALMWFAIWRHQMPPMVALIATAGAGCAFGLSMATYYAYGRRKYKLPLWQELPDN